jgi:hypothetical protein
MPPSPTIEIAGVRVGTDKLSHFFLGGPWLEITYRAALKRGASRDEATRRAIALGILTERTVLGASSSGIVSLGDLEANYQGFLFFRPLRRLIRADADARRLAPDAAVRPPRLRDTGMGRVVAAEHLYAITLGQVKPVMAGYAGFYWTRGQRRRAARVCDRVTPTE